MKPAAQVPKLLFICSRNKIRSLTAEKVFGNRPDCHVRSAGTRAGARIVVTEGHLGWADIIFCMEKSHASQLRAKFTEALEGKRLICLRIPDDYEFMQPELVDELIAKVSPYLPSNESAFPLKPGLSCDDAGA